MESPKFDCLISSSDQLSDIVWTVRADSQISSSNQHWQDFSGIPAASKLEQKFPPAGCIHPTDVVKLESLWYQAQKSNQPFSAELRMKRASDQQYLWHLLRAWPVTSTDDATPSWLIISTDVHHLKTVQSMFQLVMDNIPISIFWKNRDSVYLGCNRMFASDVGRTDTEELIGKCDYDNPSSKEENDFFVACDQRVMASGVAEYHIIESQLRSDGKRAWLDTNKIPLRDAGGEIVGVLGMYEDITDRITIEQQREDFIATLTHDLKNPLLGTNRMLELFLDGQLGSIDDKQKEILAQVKEGNSVLIGMIQKLNDIYRYDTLKYIPDVELINVTELLEEIVSESKISAQSKRITLELILVPSAQHIKAQTSALAFRRIVQNLLDNALKFTPEAGRITVTLVEQQSCFRVEVTDNGPGIDSEDQKHLFDRFWQGSAGRKYSQSIGLGLYLCKKIVDAHRGQICCVSSPGYCKFAFSIPYHFNSAGGSE